MLLDYLRRTWPSAFLFQQPRHLLEMPIPEVTQTPPVTPGQSHTSVLLRGLIDSAASAEYFTLVWLIGSLPERSFGVIVLFLALVSLLPVISIVSRLLILILVVQAIIGYRSPVFPQRLLLRPLPTRYLARLDRHVIPALKHLEKVVRPRWPLFLQRAGRIAGVIVLLLTVLSLLAPLPFANVPVAIITILMALAYIEHDGLMLSIALFMALAVLLAAVAATFYAA